MKVPASDIRSPYYMREVIRFYRWTGDYPTYYASKLTPCKQCGHHFSPSNMVGSTCTFCEGERYFLFLAKSRLRRHGINPKLHPELLDIEVVRSKTRYLTSKQSDLFINYKIKTPQL